MAKKKLPHAIYIKIENEGTKDEYFSADASRDALVSDDDNVSEIGLYKLERIGKYIKTVEEL